MLTDRADLNRVAMPHFLSVEVWFGNCANYGSEDCGWETMGQKLSFCSFKTASESEIEVVHKL